MARVNITVDKKWLPLTEESKSLVPDNFVWQCEGFWKHFGSDYLIDESGLLYEISDGDKEFVNITEDSSFYHNVVGEDYVGFEMSIKEGKIAYITYDAPFDHLPYEKSAFKYADNKYIGSHYNGNTKDLVT